MYKKIADYFQRHVGYNSIVHVIGGIGIGILITSPIINPHPVRWGIALLGVSILGHLYALAAKK